MSHYILSGEISEENDLEKSLSRSACINLNKRGGGKRDITVRDYSLKYSRFIKKQIELINPKNVVCLGTYKYLKQINIISNENKELFIDMWHTAYPMPRRIRGNKYKLKDLNVDLYMEEFINRLNNKNKGAADIDG